MYTCIYIYTYIYIYIYIHIHNNNYNNDNDNDEHNDNNTNNNDNNTNNNDNTFPAGRRPADPQELPRQQAQPPGPGNKIHVFVCCKKTETVITKKKHNMNYDINKQLITHNSH